MHDFRWLGHVICLALASGAVAQYNGTLNFNNTVQFTLSSIEPMVRFDVVRGQWRLDEATGYRRTARTRGQAEIHFIGTGFQVHGSLGWDESQAASTNRSEAPLALVVKDEKSDYREWYWSLEPPLTGGPHIASLYPIELDAYVIEFNYHNGSAVEFTNITIDVPVLTQA